MKKGKIILLAAVLVLALTQVAFPALRAVGPVNPANGFPLWYRSATGQTVTLSVPPNAVSIPDPVIPGNAFSAQIGFGSEAMYWHSTATMPVAGGGDALLVLALEAAFGGGDAAPNDQIVFARVRIRIDTVNSGTFTVTHPYGSKTFVVAPGDEGTRAINDTVDIGLSNFAQALEGDIGPFLVQTGAPAGTLGDAATSTTVTGSPTGNNFFRVSGPDGTFETNLFVTGAELFNGVPFKISRSTFSRDAGGTSFAEVFANTPTPITPGIALTANLPAQAPQPLTQVGNLFFGRFQFPNALPAQVTVTGSATGVANTSLQNNLVDTILINKATYSVGLKRLTIAATSSDAQAVLRGFGWVGATAAGRPLPAVQGADNIFNNITIAPTSVTVKSALGGTEAVQTTILP